MIAMLGLGVVFGAAMRAGALDLLADLRGFALALAVALAASQALHLAGVVDLTRSVPQPLGGMFVGGAIFGLGMVLAQGCAARMLALMAGGDLRALAVLVSFALTVQATATGVLAPLRGIVAGLPGPRFAPSLPQVLADQGVPPGAAHVVAVAGVLLALVIYAAPVLRDRRAAIAATAVGLTVAAGWLFSAGSIGFAGPVVDSLRMLTSGSGSSQGPALVAGVLIGAFIAALTGGSFRIQSGGGLGAALLGGLLMGFGSVLALGCAVGQGLSGASTLATGSLVALGGMLAGRWAGLASGLARG